MTAAGEHGRDDAALRARRRAFIRTAHPDVGGDPERFAAGLAAFDRSTESRPVRAAGLRVTVHRSRRPDRVISRAVRDWRRRLSGQPGRRLL